VIDWALSSSFFENCVLEPEGKKTKICYGIIVLSIRLGSLEVKREKESRMSGKFSHLLEFEMAWEKLMDMIIMNYYD
jgi:hypothetical protein